MYTYKFKFSNNNRSTNTVKNLTEAEAIAVAYMENHSSVVKCEITTPSGGLSIVRKTGEYHWNHNGYGFSQVKANEVEKYRSLNRE